MNTMSKTVPHRRTVFPALLLTVAALAWSVAIRAQSPDLLMGNPSNATADPANADNFLMVKQYFALSYNNSKGTPNWVSWRLTADDIGTAPRVAFYPDSDLPGGFHKIKPADYTAFGFDRGHMCDHSDRSATADSSHATFVMSNMIPQSPNVNEKAWAQLEAYCRQLAEQGHRHLYIVAGPAGQGGEGKKGRMDQIGKTNAVVVPAKCWKVVMVVDGSRGDDLQKVDANTRLIAVIMPNDMTLGEQWAGFRVSVHEVEQLTGYTFFTQVPAAVIEPLKDEVDAEPIAAPSALTH
jgi:endonuclease G